MAILTYQDAIRLLQDYVGGTSFSRALGDIKQAVRRAQSAVYRERPWTYYRSVAAFTTLTEMTTGTIAYSHSAYTATFSSNVGTRFRDSGRGSIAASSVIGSVDRFTTNTAIMDQALNWGQDIASGTSYILFQDHFVLPEGFRNIDVTVRGDNGEVLRYVPPEQFVYHKTVSASTGDPVVYTIMSDTKIPGRYAIFLYPAPNSLATYRVQYQRAPRELRLTGDETASSAGTLTTTAGSRYATGASSSFSSLYHEGAVLRASSSATAPTLLDGSNPFAEEFVIANVSSTTALEFRANATSAYSAVAYVISDPIDVPPDIEDAFIARCRLELARMRPDTKRQDLVDCERAYLELLRPAKSADAKDRSLRITGGVPYYYDLANIPTGEDVS